MTPKFYVLLSILLTLAIWVLPLEAMWFVGGFACLVILPALISKILGDNDMMP